MSHPVPPKPNHDDTPIIPPIIPPFPPREPNESLDEATPPSPRAPPVCTPEQEANGQCLPPVRGPETPPES